MDSDFGCYDCAELDYNLLDPGIREVVRILISKGFETTDSGDGHHKVEHGWTEEEIVPFPHVYIHVEPEDILSECNWLQWELEQIGIEVVSQTEAWAGENTKPYIEAIYDPVSLVAIIGLFHVTSDMVTRALTTK